MKILKIIKNKNRRIKALLFDLKQLRKEFKSYKKKHQDAIVSAELERHHYKTQADFLLKYAAKVEAHVAMQRVINTNFMLQGGISEKYNLDILHNLEKAKKQIANELKH